MLRLRKNGRQTESSRRSAHVIGIESLSELHPGIHPAAAYAF
jgi:hypothetical protein